MNTVSRILTFSVLLATLFVTSCKKDNPPPAPTTGKLNGVVMDAKTSTALSDAMVIVFDAATNQPVATVKSDASGNYTFDLAEGTYFVKVYKQGFDPNPPASIQPVPFTVTLGQTTTNDVQIFATTATNIGWISGKVSVASVGQAGVLVIAEGTGVAYSSITDKDGLYIIYNVPAGSYQVNGYLKDHSSTPTAATVTANTETPNVNVTLTKGVTGQVVGSFKVISQTGILTPPTNMDIALVHPITKETIPGLSLSLTYSSSINFTFNNVPDGTYIVRATFANDYIVVDPNYIVKFGEPKVTLAAGVQTPNPVNITATSAVTLTSPTNAMTSTVPVDAAAIPTFTWSAYPSTSDYVIEVVDAGTGTVIWGGFSKDANNNPVKNIVIPSATLSVVFNSDGKASSTLQVGKTYRWRVYASKNDQSVSGWSLISSSEDQMGLIKIK